MNHPVVSFSIESESSTMTSSHHASASTSGGIWIGFFTDLRHAFRLLWKSKGITATTLLTLALGIGATTAIFSTVYSLMSKPLPVSGTRADCGAVHVRGEGRPEPHAGQHPVLHRLFDERDLLREHRAVDVHRDASLAACASSKVPPRGDRTAHVFRWQCGPSDIGRRAERMQGLVARGDRNADAAIDSDEIQSLVIAAAPNAAAFPFAPVNPKACPGVISDLKLPPGSTHRRLPS